MLHDDATTLGYLENAAINSQKIAIGRSRGDFDNDITLRFALIYCVLIIGECASKISLTLRHDNPQIPWHNMISMRNILIHSFYAIDHGVCWNVLAHEIPQLLAQLKQVKINDV
ncbi:MAG: DUF86 domain-containing protein [Candidatus Symbiobacter sp.]|nr:DUF86 domain-containing protein [Candidatus Symbiobacter sp.]